MCWFYDKYSSGYAFWLIINIFLQKYTVLLESCRFLSNYTCLDTEILNVQYIRDYKS